jgi:hypothetical protein
MTLSATDPGGNISKASVVSFRIVRG